MKKGSEVKPIVSAIEVNGLMVYRAIITSKEKPEAQLRAYEMLFSFFFKYNEWSSGRESKKLFRALVTAMLASAFYSHKCPDISNRFRGLLESDTKEKIFKFYQSIGPERLSIDGISQSFGLLCLILEKEVRGKVSKDEIFNRVMAALKAPLSVMANIEAAYDMSLDQFVSDFSGNLAAESLLRIHDLTTYDLLVGDYKEKTKIELLQGA